VDSVKLALGPMMFKKIDSPYNKRFYSKALLYSSYVLMFAVIAVSLFSLEIIMLIARSKEFRDAVAIIPVLSLSIFFINMKEITVYGLHIAKRTKLIGLIVVLATVSSLIINLLLIPLWDMTGAAVATLLSQFIYLIACYYFSQKAFFIPYETRKILIMFLTGAALSFSGLIFNEINLLPRLLFKTGALISFPFILFLFNFYEPVELQSIKGFLAKWANPKNLRDNLKSLKGIRDE